MKMLVDADVLTLASYKFHHSARVYFVYDQFSMSDRFERILGYYVKA